ncbi:hypothetical protein AAFF_G00137070 [Aldrovandia affinis]|uniref:Leucine-rich repeat-containing protein 27 n=1 Tax=Aldrovandia affinis TaxID=143900 RepID=A0AAD7TBZ4_9TELE|nr:hypothetical protein AAFF_G00137070 [Aldrovandia affinis]
MASLELDISALRLSSASGDTVVKKPSLRVPLESAAEMQIAQEVPVDTLCLNRRKLNHIDYSILRISTIKHFYLEGNEISILPGTLFSSMPNLVWLDLRNNQIAQLPPEIGQHRFLETLLLEGNPITELPLELGKLVTLRALSLRRCPIVFPPQEVLCKGVQCILRFLRRAMAERPVSARIALPVLVDVSPVEKLRLSSLSFSEEAADATDAEELQRFEELKLRVMQMERAEFVRGAPAPYHPPNRRAARSEGGPRGHTAPSIRRKREPTKGKFLDLPLCDVQYRKRSEERKLAATQELKEKQAVLEQRKKDQQVLREWRSEARIRQEGGVPESGRRTREEEVLRRAPYATDPPSNMEDNAEYATHNALQHKPGQRSLSSLKELKEMRGFLSSDLCDPRAAQDMELKRRIQNHFQTIQERRRRPRDLAREEHEVEEVNMLQQEALAERKQKCKQDYRFTAFTGEDSPRSYMS